MKRKLTTTFAIGLLLVALVALAIAPAASAKASFITINGIEYATGSTPMGMDITGAVAHVRAENYFVDYAAAGPDPFIDGTTTTQMYAVAKVVDGVPGDAIIRGTFHRVTAAGEWDGTLAGTMNLVDFTWDCICVGRGTSGQVTGWIMNVHNVKTVPGFADPAIITGWAIAPKGT